MFNSKKLKFKPSYKPQNKYAPARSKYIKPRKPSGISAKIGHFAVSVSILTLIGFLIFLIFFSGFFTVKEIDLKEKNIENQQIIEQVRKILKASMGENILFIDTLALETKILKNISELQKVEISKNLPSSLEVDFEQYPLAANIVNESPNLKKSYIINSMGFVIKEDFEDTKLPYIRIKSDQVINPKKAVIDNKKLTYIIDATKYFQDKFGMRIVEVEYKPIAREIRLLTEREFRLWLDIQIPFEDQFRKLKKALVKLDIYKDSLDYIDLRIAGGNGDKIIYKRK